MTKRILAILALTVLSSVVSAPILSAADVKPIPPEPPRKYPEQSPNLGAIHGKIVLSGGMPTLKDLAAVKPTDHKFCGTKTQSERVVVSPKNELRSVVIAIKGYKPAKKPAPRPVVIDNKTCYFVPHVVATTIGSPIDITNSDATLHNARGTPIGRAGWRAAFNRAIPAKGKITVKASRKPGWGTLACDMHPWMSGHIQVFDHELFDVTNDTGDFKIVNVPPGEYALEIWHEMLAPGLKRTELKAAGKVKVEAGKPTTLNLEVVLDKAKPNKSTWQLKK